MSRIGKEPIAVPDGAEVRIDGRRWTLTGSVGTVEVEVHPRITAGFDSDARIISVTRTTNDRFSRSLHGLMRSLLANAVAGVTQGFEKRLVISGVGYNAKLTGSELTLNVGFCHPVVMTIPDGLNVQTPSNTEVAVKGADKQAVGQFAAEIRKVRPPEPYNGKGIRYADEQIRRKAGKTMVGAT